MRKLMLLTIVAVLSVSVGHTAPGTDWAINATAIEACSCPHFCMCYFNSHPAAHHENGKTEHYCKFNNAYKVNQGHYGETDLTGAKFWLRRFGRGFLPRSDGLGPDHVRQGNHGRTKGSVRRHSGPRFSCQVEDDENRRGRH